jgi:hypothetical protein
MIITGFCLVVKASGSHGFKKNIYNEFLKTQKLLYGLLGTVV